MDQGSTCKSKSGYSDHIKAPLLLGNTDDYGTFSDISPAELQSLMLEIGRAPHAFPPEILEHVIDDPDAMRELAHQLRAPLKEIEQGEDSGKNFTYVVSQIYVRLYGVEIHTDSKLEQLLSTLSKLAYPLCMITNTMFTTVSYFGFLHALELDTSSYILFAFILAISAILAFISSKKLAGIYDGFRRKAAKKMQLSILEGIYPSNMSTASLVDASTANHVINNAGSVVAPPLLGAQQKKISYGDIADILIQIIFKSFSIAGIIISFLPVKITEKGIGFLHQYFTWKTHCATLGGFTIVLLFMSLQLITNYSKDGKMPEWLIKSFRGKVKNAAFLTAGTYVFVATLERLQASIIRLVKLSNRADSSIAEMIIISGGLIGGIVGAWPRFWSYVKKNTKAWQQEQVTSVNISATKKVGLGLTFFSSVLIAVSTGTNKYAEAAAIFDTKWIAKHAHENFHSIPVFISFAIILAVFCFFILSAAFGRLSYAALPSRGL